MSMDNENLSSQTITEGLGTRFIGQRVLYFPSVTSTNDVARQEAQQGAPEGTAVIADEQTAGKGRLKRTWLTPKGNVAVSIVFRPALSHLSSFIMLASLAVVHTIKSVTGVVAQIKWPNDVLINGKKVCGILIESDVRGDKVNFAVVGIGINVNLSLADFPEVRATATSLSDESGRNVSRSSVIRCLLVEIEKLYLVLSSGGPIYEEWRGNLVTLGQQVRVRSGETVYEGTAESVARDGSLLLRGSDGSLRQILVGDVTLRD
ncbi:MAG: biotin--[acetyl-CoA-carboxylase] ligase [Chloroflexota bacterium]